MALKLPNTNFRLSGLFGSKNTKGAAAPTSSGPAKNAKTAASTSQSVEHQDELQQRFQALKDSMPQPAKHAGTTKAQGGDHHPAPAGNELVPVKSYYDGGKSSASDWRMPYDGPELLNGSYMKPAPSWRMPYDGPELLNGTHMKPSPSWKMPYDGPELLNGTHMKPSPSGSKLSASSASSPGAHTPPSKSNSMEPETHSMALTTTTPPSKTHSTAGGGGLEGIAAKEKREANIKTALGIGAVAAIGLTAWAAIELSKGDSSDSNQKT